MTMYVKFQSSVRSQPHYVPQQPDSHCISSPTHAATHTSFWTRWMALHWPNCYTTPTHMRTRQWGVRKWSVWGQNTRGAGGLYNSITEDITRKTRWEGFEHKQCNACHDKNYNYYNYAVCVCVTIVTVMLRLGSGSFLWSDDAFTHPKGGGGVRDSEIKVVWHRAQEDRQLRHQVGEARSGVRIPTPAAVDNPVSAEGKTNHNYEHVGNGGIAPIQNWLCTAYWVNKEAYQPLGSKGDSIYPFCIHT